MDSKLKKWLRWTDEIHRETQNLLIKTYLYDLYVEIVKANHKVQNPRDFHDWSTRNYFDSALMCIRRLTKAQLRGNKLENICLTGLLLEIRDSPQLITEQFYLRDYPPKSKGVFLDGDSFTRSLGETTFREKWGGGGRGLAAIVENDLKLLEEKTKVVEDFIDSTLAHRQSGTKGKQTLQTIDARNAIKIIEEIAKRYTELMGRGSFVDLTPVYQYDPAEIFLYPWIVRAETS